MQEIQDFWQQHQYSELEGRAKIMESFCPQVYGLYAVKLAVSVVLCGGLERVDQTGTKIRGEPHMVRITFQFIYWRRTGLFGHFLFKILAGQERHIFLIDSINLMLSCLATDRRPWNRQVTDSPLCVKTGVKVMLWVAIRYWTINARFGVTFSFTSSSWTKNQRAHQLRMSLLSDPLWQPESDQLVQVSRPQPLATEVNGISRPELW